MPDQTFAFMDIFIDMKKKLCLDVNQLNIFNTFWSNLHYFLAFFFSARGLRIVLVSQSGLRRESASSGSARTHLHSTSQCYLPAWKELFLC